MNATVFQPMDMTIAETLLKEAKQILDQRGLVFFLRHGTCLGAVRDHGFIEWDDDLDIGSVLGLHGLTEEIVYDTAAVFRQHGYEVKVVASDLHLSVDLKKSGTQMDWTCYRVIDGSIYQWPAVKIPVTLHENLKEIDFIGTTFMTPNPPEEYLRLKYGEDWHIPKGTGQFEQDVLNLMDRSSAPGGSDEILNLSNRHDPNRHTGSLVVVDVDGETIAGAEISLAATTVLTTLNTSTTNQDGQVYFSLPEEASYVVSVTIRNRTEILYLEELAPGIDYLYKPDAVHSSGRANALIVR